MRITQEELHEILDYMPDTGEFFWKHTGSEYKKGDRAGKEYQNGYRYVSIAGVYFPCALLAWIYMTGEDPDGVIDHKNLVRTDDSFANLRPATNSQNHANREPPSHNTSGFKGVFWNSQKKKWHARLMADGKQVHIGFYPTIKEAVIAHREAAINQWGEFARVPSLEEIEEICSERLNCSVNASDLGL